MEQNTEHKCESRACIWMRVLLIITFDDFWFLHFAHIRLRLALQGGGKDWNQGVNSRTQHRQGQVLAVLGAKIENH